MPRLGENWRGEHWRLERRPGERLARPETGIERTGGPSYFEAAYPIILIRLPGWRLILRGQRVRLES